MISRSLTPLVEEVARSYPVVAITGPRQAGKTTMAEQTFRHLPYVSLEDPLEQANFEADPKAWLARFPDGAVLDEIQRIPDLPRWLLGVVHRDRRMGRFVVTGSQQYQVMDRITQSLAGRVARIELMPFSHAELLRAKLAPVDPATAIWKGGYPPLYDRPVNPGRWLGDYVATYIERDVRNVIAVRDLVRFAAFLRLCATRCGQIVNLSNMASDIGIDAKTAREWLSVLAAGYVVHLLRPYHANLGKRITKHPKLYFLDTGIACRLLAIGSPDDLRGHPFWGALVENWVVVEAIKARRSRGHNVENLFYWRSHDGLEVDLIVERGQIVSPIEIKATTSPAPSHLQGLDRFRALAHKRAAHGALVHFGDERAEMRGHRLCPWRDVDALPLWA